MVAWTGDALGDIVFDRPPIAGEGGFTVVIAELPNGNKIVAFHGGKDAGMVGRYWKLWNVERAGVCGYHATAIRDGGLDGVTGSVVIVDWCVLHDEVARASCVCNGHVGV